MSNKFQDKYRSASARLQNNKYGSQETGETLSQKIQGIIPENACFQNQGKNSISFIIGSCKSAVSKHVHRLGYRFAWQARFHDRIIRDKEALMNVRKYIENNVDNWGENPFNT